MTTLKTMQAVRHFGLGGTLQQGFFTTPGTDQRYLAPKYPLEEVVGRALSDMPRRYAIIPHEIRRRDSNNHDAVDIYTLLFKVHEAMVDTAVDAVIVTMGTDTMADFASLLAFCVRPSPKPVIFTGSMKTIDHEENDIRPNLVHTIRLAERIVDDALLAKGELYNGVAIVIGNHAVYAHSAVKIRIEDKMDTDTFVCAWNKPLATFTGEEVKIHKTNVDPYAGVPQLYLPKLGATKIEPLSLSTVPDFASLVSAEAIVYLGTGDGNFSASQRAVMEMLAQEFAIPQIVCSSVPQRNGYSLYETGMTPEGVLPSLLPVTATQAKVAVALGAARHLTRKTKQRFVLDYFRQDVVGEYGHARG